MPTLADQWIGLAREAVYERGAYVHTWTPAGRVSEDGWVNDTGPTWTLTVDPWGLDVDVRELVARRLLEHYGLPAPDGWPDGVNGFRSGRPMGFRRGR